jgi:endonuclease-3
MTKKEKALEIYKRLLAVYPKPIVELQFKTPLELLIATMLSAQCTDKLVNTVTPALFAKYKTAGDFAQASVEDIDKYIKKVTFHNNKAKNINAACRVIVEKHGGKVPDAMEELDALPGVARKTANVVLSHAFGKAEGIVIDTHGIRLSNKLGLTDSKDPVKIEQDLMALLPKDTWIAFGSMLTLHGRYKCVARPHLCDNCPLGDLCPEYKN